MRRRNDAGGLAPRRAVWLLRAAFMMVVFPLMAHISPAVIGLVILCAWGAGSDVITAVPVVFLKILAFGAGLAVILFSYGTLIGLEPGISFLLVLSALKLIEARHPRDFRVLVLLGYFLVLTLVFFNPGAGMALFCLVLLVVFSAALVQANAGAVVPVRLSVRKALVLGLQGLPLALVLFLLFPRGSGLPFELNSPRALSGLTETLEPGSIAQLALSDEPVFRVVFPDGGVPAPAEMYWRGIVMWEGSGLHWRADNLPLIEHPAAPSTTIRQQITLQPHRNRWLFALDRPAETIRDASMLAGGYLVSHRRINQPLRYEVFSTTDPEPGLLSSRMLSLATRVDAAVLTPRVRSLVESLRAGSDEPDALIENALRFFSSENFVYTLEPGTYLSDNMDEFLFGRREGFCEHFAGAFATLMRAAGVPSRVIVGYQGGNENPRGRYWSIRQSHAHAWCEVWLAGRGWVRVDPTRVVAPARLEGQMMTPGAGGNQSTALDFAASLLGLSGVMDEIRMFWDNVEFQWDQTVLEFDTFTQWNLFGAVGLGAPGWIALLLWMVAGAAVVGLFLALVFRVADRRRKDPVRRMFDEFSLVASRRGVVLRSSEGPVDLMHRLQQTFPRDACLIGLFCSEYLCLRYGKSGFPLEVDSLRDALAQWKRTGRTQ